MVASKQEKTRTTKAQVLSSSIASRSLITSRDFKIYAGNEDAKNNGGVRKTLGDGLRRSDMKMPLTGRKSVSVLPTGKSFTTSTVSNNHKKETEITKADDSKCDQPVKRKSARKALVDLTNQKVVGSHHPRNNQKSGVTIKKSSGERSINQSRITLTKTIVNAKLPSKKPLGAKGKNSMDILSKHGNFEITHARSTVRYKSTEASEFPKHRDGRRSLLYRSSLASRKAVEVNASLSNPSRVVKCGKLVDSKVKIAPVSRAAFTKKNSIDKEAKIPASSSPKTRNTCSPHESSSGNHHPAGLFSSDEKEKHAVTKVNVKRRKSFTSSFFGNCASSYEMDKLPSIDNNMNPLEVVDYVDDIYNYYWTMEFENPLPENYMARQMDITSAMRSILIDWLIEVHQKFGLMQETLFLMVELLDRTLSCFPVKKANLQLVGLTALLLASKYEDYWHPKIEDLLSLTSNYTRSDMLKMEKLILAKLKYRLNWPTPYVFMLRFLKASQSDKKLEHLSYYLIELCLVQYDALKFKPSLLCASAVYVARCTLEIVPAWSELLSKHTRYNEKDFRDCASMILQFQRAANKARLKSTYDKFLSNELSSVASVKALSKLP